MIMTNKKLLNKFYYCSIPMKKLLLLLTFLPLMAQADPVDIGGIYYD